MPTPSSPSPPERFASWIAEGVRVLDDLDRGYLDPATRKRMVGVCRAMARRLLAKVVEIDPWQPSERVVEDFAIHLGIEAIILDQDPVVRVFDLAGALGDAVGRVPRNRWGEVEHATREVIEDLRISRREAAEPGWLDSHIFPNEAGKVVVDLPPCP